MAIRGLFIGINRHADPATRELRGARPDAVALHALMLDAMPSMRGTLLTDAEATHARVLGELQGTLANAAPDDTVVVSFSGHGTRNHRLVVHDSARFRLTETTIGMSEVASLFRETRARAVLCILDCCFSGGANARVLDDSPTGRDPHDPLEDLAGKGRVLLAASNVNEPAWETGGTGHGLLTKAVIDTLLATAGGVDIQNAMASIMSAVRLGAERMGVRQTPVMLGHIEGGLSLPAFSMGANYLAAFPARVRPRVGREIGDLVALGMPASAVTVWRSLYPSGLNDLQLRAVNDERVLDGESLLVVAPTSAGKTFVGEMAAVRAVAGGQKAVFLLPYKALVNEKYEHFERVYGESLGLRVVRSTGDYQDENAAFILGRYDLAILTFEMFLRIAVSTPHVLEALGLVVLDEAQFITDPNRGISVELLLTFLSAARERGIKPQLVALSAVIGDVNDFDAWLGVRKLVSTSRPVPLVEGVLDRSGTFTFVDENGVRGEKSLVPACEIVQRKAKPGTQDVLVPLARALMADGETILVFRNRRGPARGCAQYLARELGLPRAADALSALPLQDLSSASQGLRECLAGGTAFHTSDLTRDERAVVEREFRRKDVPLRVACATTTLAAGVNTPASVVIIAEQEFLGEDGRPFTVAEYKNMAGRAGRLDYRDRGTSIVLADTAYDRKHLFAKYVMGTPEPLRSSFDPTNPSTWLLRLLAQVPQVARAAVPALLANTFGGYLASKTSPASATSVEVLVERLVERMLRLELLEEEGERIGLTLLGRACGASALSFESCMRLIEVLRAVGQQQIDVVRLVALVQLLDESDGGYTPIMKKGRAEHTHVERAGACYGRDIVRSLQRHARNEWEYVARCKRAAILADWVAGVPAEAIERRFTTNPFQGVIGLGDVVRFADATRFHLRSAHQIAALLFIDGAAPAEVVDSMTRRLQLGIPEDVLPLLDLPFSLTRGELLELRALRTTTVDAFWSLPTLMRERVLGVERNRQIASQRPAVAIGA
jgi:helicase